jgi:hypothetical protein
MHHSGRNAMTWKKSSYGGAGPNCVEVALTQRAVAVRDSEDPHGPARTFAPGTFTRLLCNLR